MHALPVEQLRRAEAAAKTMLIGTMLRSGFLLATILFFSILATVIVLLN